MNIDWLSEHIRKWKKPSVNQLATHIRRWKNFDAEWYRRRHLKDSPKSDPALHYLTVGAALGNDPSPGFDGTYYLQANDDVRYANHNPLLHYLFNGSAEGRDPLPRRSRTACILLADRANPMSLLRHHSAINMDIFVLAPLGTAFAETVGEADNGVRVLVHDPSLTSAETIRLAHNMFALSRYEMVCILRAPVAQPDAATSITFWTNQASVLAAIIDRPAPQLVGNKEGQRNVLAADYTNWLSHAPADLRGRIEQENLINWSFFTLDNLWVSQDLLSSALVLMDSSNNSVGSAIAPPIEQKFGLLAALTKNNPVALEDLLPESQAPAKKSPLKASEMESAIKLRGNLDLRERVQQIDGWLARIGDAIPRTAVIRSDGIELRVTASDLRKDLREHKINDGFHAFSLSVPHAFLDGKEREFTLTDGETGQIVASKKVKWMRSPRPYVNFAQFLTSSMTQPLIQAPFTEEDKRSFAVMENIADRLCTLALAEPTAPLVSVIMPVYNRIDLVGSAIRSVLNQRYANFELIVIDDGSADQSAEVVRTINDPRLKLTVLPENYGHSRARNVGLLQATGQIIAYLDSDNEWDDRYLGATVGAYLERPQADAFITGQYLYRGKHGEPHSMRFAHMNQALLENRNFADLNSFTHKRALLDKVGGFNEAIKRFVDYDLILRSTLVGSVWSVPVALTHYHFDRATETVTKGEVHSEQLDQVRAAHDAAVASMLERRDRAELARSVSVVIPNWQSLDDIHDCIEALHARDWQGKLDVIVVDNFSDVEVLDYLRAEHAQGRIRLLENNMNAGFTYAVNRGIGIADPLSDILILNNDAIMKPGSIQALQEAAYSLPEAGMTVPRQILPVGTKTVTAHGPFAATDRPSDANLSAHHRNIERIGLYHDGGPVELNYAPFFATYIRRDVLCEIGLLDAEFGRHYRSDRVYCDLMRSVMGRKIWYVPEAHVIHKLQKATDNLRATDATSEAFTLMFQRGSVAQIA